MDSIKLLTMILMIILGIMIMLLIVLGIVFMTSKMNKKEEEEKKDVQNNNKAPKSKKFKEYRTASVLDFMEFDTVIDNMISQKDGKRYIMVVECQGINYDLMSEVEKNSVEEGFLQFLNTLRHPVQIYTQTRTINLENSIQTYKEKVKEIENALEKQETKYKQMIKSESYTQEQLNRAYFELTKQKNLYEYGKDIIYSTEKMSSNKNVLNKKYYVVIPYFVEELGDNSFDKEEQRSLAFSELYTRAQSVVRTLAVCGINSRIMDSNELVELLYVAYNRDEAEVYGLEKALKAGYDELYSTAPDVVDKQMRALDKQIEDQALELAQQKVTEARTEKQKALQEKRLKERDLIGELAELMISENAQLIGEDIAVDAIEKLKEETKEEGGKGSGKEKQKRTRKTKTA
ncbi:MAG: hypothetical protein HFJ42_03490 [Clostridia bacterium]|nr:hypothetical protein [Clostridia bacterium]